MRFMVDRTGVLAALGYVVCGLGACVPVETPADDDVTDADVSAPRDEAASDAGGGGGGAGRSPGGGRGGGGGSFNAGANPA
jgi:hypothetical protein